MFCKNGVLRNFAKFTRKHLRQSLFFNKVVDQPANLLKARLWHRFFPVNFAKFLRTPFFIEHLCWNIDSQDSPFQEQESVVPFSSTAIDESGSESYIYWNKSDKNDNTDEVNDKVSIERSQKHTRTQCD